MEQNLPREEGQAAFDLEKLSEWKWDEHPQEASSSDSFELPPVPDEQSEPLKAKGPFTQKEDRQLQAYVRKFGAKNWALASKFVPGRSGKQLRERWSNHLAPDLYNHPWTFEEDKTILKYHNELGSKWSQISKMLPGRSDNAVKNRWNGSISKRIQSDGTLIPNEDFLETRKIQRRKERLEQNGLWHVLPSFKITIPFVFSDVQIGTECKDSVPNQPPLPPT